MLALPAHAVVLRGHVTTPLGQPLPGSRVQLISLSGGPRNAASTIAGIGGDYEIRINLGGRFLLLTSPSPAAPLYAPQIGNPFYAGRADLLLQEITLDFLAVTPRASAQATLLPTPPAQLSARPTQVQADQLLTDATPLSWLAQTPSALVVQTGQVGAPATLYLRGAPVTSVAVDGVTAEPLGSSYNLGTLTSSGLAALLSTPALELTPTPLPVRFLDSTGGALALSTPVASSLRPTLTYSGDGGNLSTTRNEAIVSVTRRRADALGSFARFNSDNDLPAASAHLITLAANVGYHISSATSLRATAHQEFAASPLALPFALYGVQPAGREAAQNLYAQLTFETRTLRNWHNLLRYGLARQRAETQRYETLANGVPVSITGANGYTASGVAQFPAAPLREDVATNRDEYTYLTDYPIRQAKKSSLAGLLTVRFQDERALRQQQFAAPLLRTIVGRTHFSLAGVLAGQVRHRVFVQASGFIDYSALLGLRGAPRVGLTYVPVRPGARRFRGTSLHVTAGSGLREPTLLQQLSTARPAPGRARSLEFGIDQAIFAQKLTLRTTYFHNQFSHEAELLSLSPVKVADTLAYRTQGLESSMRYQPGPRLELTGSYTYLASLVEQSSANAVSNPFLPGIPIGALTALPGSRPFHRPPHNGSFAIQYTGSTFTASLRGALTGRSDDSTNLPQSPLLLLPNRDLSPGYVALDASATYAVNRRITAYSQLNNLLDSRHIAPIGYFSAPFQVRAGLRIRLGGE